MDLRIRKLNQGDLEPLYRLLSDERVMRYLEPPYTRARTEEFLEEVNRFDSPLVYAVEEEDSFIGYVIFHDYDETTMEIGWVLYPEYWGRGYASYLTELMMARCRELKKAPMIECDPEQEVSGHIARKYGFGYVAEIDGLDVYVRKNDSEE